MGLKCLEIFQDCQGKLSPFISSTSVSAVCLLINFDIDTAITINSMLFVHRPREQTAITFS